MLKSISFILLLTLFFGGAVYAQPVQEESDPYNACVEQTIQEQQLASINNSVVQICSDQAKHGYEKQIVALLDQIRVQSADWKQPENLSRIFSMQK